jgi:hypothetical protein
VLLPCLPRLVFRRLSQFSAKPIKLEVGLLDVAVHDPHACNERLDVSARSRDGAPGVTATAGPRGALSTTAASRRRMRRLAALSDDHGFPHRLGLGTVHCGWSSTALGQAQEGLTSLKEGLSAIRATGTVNATPFALTMLAEAHATLGRYDEGLNSLAEAEQIIERTEERRDQAELHRVRGDVLSAGGDQARGRAELLPVARRC